MSELSKGIFAVMIAVCAIILAVLLITIVPYGEGTIYDVAYIIGASVDNGGNHHIDVYVGSRECGTVIEHIFVFKRKDILVTQEEFLPIIRSDRINIKYTCDNGRIKDIVWWAF